MDKIRLDDLQYRNLQIYQYIDGYCFTSDAVILANLPDVNNATIVDLCSGTGVVGILAGEKNNAKKVYMVELQEKYSKLSEMSLEYNKIKERYEVINDDLINSPKTIGHGVADIVLCNPPYKKNNCSVMAENEELQIAKHELRTNLNDIILTSSKLLKFGGKLYICNKEERLAEIIYLCRKYNLEPKQLWIRTSKKGANIIFICASLGGKEGIKISIINSEDEVIVK